MIVVRTILLIVGIYGFAWAFDTFIQPISPIDLHNAKITAAKFADNAIVETGAIIRH